MKKSFKYGKYENGFIRANNTIIIIANNVSDPWLGPKLRVYNARQLTLLPETLCKLIVV